MPAVDWTLFPKGFSREYLETLHTKQLMDLRRSFPTLGYDRVEQKSIDLTEEADRCEELVRDILKSRPHIPNKKESKLARQLAAKRKR